MGAVSSVNSAVDAARHQPHPTGQSCMGFKSANGLRILHETCWPGPAVGEGRETKKRVVMQAATSTRLHSAAAAEGRLPTVLPRPRPSFGPRAPQG